MAKNKTFVLSTEDKNSKNIIIKTAGIILVDFLKNPRMFIDHIISSKGVAGKWLNVRVEDNRLLGDALFYTKNPDVAEIADKVENDFISGASIGGIPIEWHIEEINGVEIVVVTKFYLIEVSITAIPSNKSCLMLFDENHNMIEDWTFSFFKKDFEFKNHKPQKNNMDFKEVGKMLGLSETATEQEVKDALSSAKTAQANLESFKAQQEQAQKAKALKLVDDAIAENRLDANRKATLLKLAETDFALFEDTLSLLPKPVSLSDRLKTGGGSGGKRSDENSSWTYLDWEEKDPKGLQLMHNENPEQFEKLYQKEFGISVDDDFAKVKIGEAVKNKK